MYMIITQPVLIILDVTKNVPRVFMVEAVNTNADVKTGPGKQIHEILSMISLMFSEIKLYLI